LEAKSLRAFKNISEKLKTEEFLSKFKKYLVFVKNLKEAK